MRWDRETPQRGCLMDTTRNKARGRCLGRTNGKEGSSRSHPSMQRPQQPKIRYLRLRRRTSIPHQSSTPRSPLPRNLQHRLLRLRSWLRASLLLHQPRVLHLSLRLRAFIPHLSSTPRSALRRNLQQRLLRLRSRLRVPLLLPDTPRALPLHLLWPAPR